MTKKIQQISNVVLLIIIAAAIIWMKFDYESKFDNIGEYIDQEIKGVQYTIIESNEQSTLSLQKIEKQIEILETHVLTLKTFVEEKLKK